MASFMRAWLQLNIVLKTTGVLFDVDLACFRLELHFAITKTYSTEQWKKKPKGLSPEPEASPELIVSLRKRLTIPSIPPSFTLNKSFLVAIRWNNSKGIDKYFLGGFWKVENCNTLEVLLSASSNSIRVSVGPVQIAKMSSTKTATRPLSY